MNMLHRWPRGRPLPPDAQRDEDAAFERMWLLIDRSARRARLSEALATRYRGPTREAMTGVLRRAAGQRRRRRHARGGRAAAPRALARRRHARIARSCSCGASGGAAERSAARALEKSARHLYALGSSRVPCSRASMLAAAICTARSAPRDRRACAPRDGEIRSTRVRVRAARRAAAILRRPRAAAGGRRAHRRRRPRPRRADEHQIHGIAPHRVKRLRAAFSAACARAPGDGLLVSRSHLALLDRRRGRRRARVARRRRARRARGACARRGAPLRGASHDVLVFGPADGVHWRLTGQPTCAAASRARAHMTICSG